MTRPSVSLVDLLRDLGALVLLFTCLAMPWDLDNDGSERWWVVITVLLAALAVAVPYIGWTALVHGFGPPQARLAKLALVAPFGIAVVAALVNELIHVTDAMEAGLGSGVAMGVGGALLAAQPRTYDDDRHDDRAWWTLCRALGYVGLAAMAVSWVVWLVRDLLESSLSGDEILAHVADGLDVLAVLGVALMIPTVGALRRSVAWARVLQVVVVTILCVNLLALSDDGDGTFSSTGVEKFSLPLFGLFLVVGAASLTVARPVQRVLRPPDEIASWVRTASHALLLSGLGLTLLVASDILRVIAFDEYSAETIVPIVVTALGVVAALAGVTMLGNNPDGARLAVLCTLGFLLIGGIIAIAVANGNDSSAQLDAFLASFWFTLPALAAGALLIPRSLRYAFRPLAAPRPHAPQ